MLTTILIKSNLSVYSLYYAEACNESAEPISASLRQGDTAFFEKMSQRWGAVGKTVSNLNLRPPNPETNALPLDQMAGFYHNFGYFILSETVSKVQFLCFIAKSIGAFNRVRDKVL